LGDAPSAAACFGCALLFKDANIGLGAPLVNQDAGFLLRCWLLMQKFGKVSDCFNLTHCHVAIMCNNEGIKKFPRGKK
jgi:hypothetical protein